MSGIDVSLFHAYHIYPSYEHQSIAAKNICYVSTVRVSYAERDNPPLKILMDLQSLAFPSRFAKKESCRVNIYRSHSNTASSSQELIHIWKLEEALKPQKLGSFLRAFRSS